MAGENLTLLDVAKRLDPNGNAATIVELLNQNNEMLMDIPYVEGNLPTGHRITQRVGLPDVYFRKLNQGVPTSKSRTVQVDEACGLLEARGSIDIELVKLNGNSASYRMQENMAFIEAIFSSSSAMWSSASFFTSLLALSLSAQSASSFSVSSSEKPRSRERRTKRSRFTSSSP